MHTPEPESAEPRHATADLFPLVYDELRRLAAHQLQAEPPGHTLQPTALIHEVYLRLAAGATAEQWDNTRHFFAAAAKAMRRILIEHARRRNRQKRGGDRHRAELGDVPVPDSDDRLLALDEALDRLAAEDPTAALVVEAHWFADLSFEHVASALGLTIYAVKRKWTFARAWLMNAVGD